MTARIPWKSLRHLSTKLGYSKTLRLPSTPFGPKIPKGEDRAKLIEKSSQALYEWQRSQGGDRSKFVFHDGPPYANGDVHLGHALNKILKDIINRWQVVYNNSLVEYRPGWDCHGLPIEMKAVAINGAGSPEEIRAECRRVATQMLDKQREQFKSFAIMADFTEPYVTMNHRYEINQLRIFERLMKNGLLSRQMKPVWWGCETQTALAEAELEYNPKHKSSSLYLKFPLETASEKFKVALQDKGIDTTKVNFLIWTSTPWTIPANKAICVHEKLTYTAIKTPQDEYLIVEKGLAESIAKFEEGSTILDINIPGDYLVGSLYFSPASRENSTFPVLHGNHVTATAGTGLVHTAPAHGGEDYLIGKASGLDIQSSVDQEGRILARCIPSGFHELNGMKVTEQECIKTVCTILKEHNMVFKLSKIVHSYPYDWRSKKPVIQRATPQWFINVEKVKEAALQSLDSVDFYPEAGKNRLLLFIKNRNEWCISRQRCWGVPLPIVYEKSTGNPLFDMDIIKHIITRIDEYGTDAWFTEEVDISRWLPKELDGKAYSKGKDTMDVWFDSGCSWNTLGDNLTTLMEANQPPADIYLEGSDQHRGWFQSSLLNKVIASSEDGVNFKPVAPYKTIITHGFTLDKNNDKMSKSKGNTIAPSDVIDGSQKPFLPSLGTDGLRLWVASSNYNYDVNVTNEVLNRVFENVKKFRVTFKFLLGNLKDFSDPVPYEKLAPLDKYTLSTLYNLQTACVLYYENFNFSRVVSEVNHHMNSQLSSLYFDISKDTLYTASVDSIRRRSIQTVLERLLVTYIGILSPIQPILTQEVWTELTKLKNEVLPESPFMMGKWNEFYQLPRNYANPEIESELNKVWTLRAAVNKELEVLRAADKYKNQLELSVNLDVQDGNLRDLLVNHNEYLDDYFLVSRATVGPTPDTYLLDCTTNVDGDAVRITVCKSTEHKCPRCWKYIAPVEDELCSKCDSVVESLNM